MLQRAAAAVGRAHAQDGQLVICCQQPHVRSPGAEQDTELPLTDSLAHEDHGRAAWHILPAPGALVLHVDVGMCALLLAGREAVAPVRVVVPVGLVQRREAGVLERAVADVVVHVERGDEETCLDEPVLRVLLLCQAAPGDQVAAELVAAGLRVAGVGLDGGQQVVVAGLEAVVGELAGHWGGAGQGAGISHRTGSVSRPQLCVVCLGVVC